MKVLGVLTSDFGLYYDLVRALKARNVPFLSLAEDDGVPPNVGAVLTSVREAPRVHARAVVAYQPDWEDGEASPEGVEVYTDAHEAVDAALRLLTGKREYHRVLVGVDPGERPGVAILGDGRVLTMTQVPNPEAVVWAVERGLAGILAGSVTVRVGHGASTHRDRIINHLLEADLPVEVVDETSTSPATYKTSEERDAVAAKSIALARGVAVTEAREVVPPAGEIRDIQRKSRLASEGQVTISRDLARKVAVGKLTLDEAVRRQKRKAASG